MTFTYNPSTSDPTLLAITNVRARIGDRTSGSGLRPDRANFTDEELTMFSVIEGGWECVAARALEILASEWRRAADITTGPLSTQLSQVAAGYERDATRERAMCGVGTQVLDLAYLEPEPEMS